MIFFNIKILAGFQAVFKLLLFFLLYPLSLRLFSFTMRVTGFPYLTKENIFSFVGHPVTLLFFLFMLFLFTACSIYEGAVMITVLELSRQKKKARFFATALFALEQWKRLWCRPNRPLFLLLLFQTPLFGVGMSASLFATVSVPLSGIFWRIRCFWELWESAFFCQFCFCLQGFILFIFL